jgi:murein DD-endopeptidase MepM/ murein hydrolase activator NlpD
MKYLAGIVIFFAIAFLFSRSSETAIETPAIEPPTAQRSAQAIPFVSIAPGHGVLQGDPFMAIIENTEGTSSVASASFADSKLPVFSYQSKPAIIAPVDLRAKPGKYDLSVYLSSGQTLHADITVLERKKIEAPLGIPEKLGGNTTSSQDALARSLDSENALINSIKSSPSQYWTEKFRFPLENIKVVDEYGYSRQTGVYSIPHKGTDFLAKEGTPVFSMNRGIVKLARTTRIYGNMVAIDHGSGIVTLYMHLSRIEVKEGQAVNAGQKIGLSGETGYAEGPHLHLSVKVNNISIDPMKFMALFPE